jgi:hypothetical protein
MTASSRSDFFRAVPAVALILAASGTNFLRYHDYPLLSAEVGLFAAFLGMVALGISGLFGIGKRYWRAFLETAVIFLAVDLNADSPMATVLAASGALTYLILTGGTLLPILTVMFGVAFLTSLAGLGETNAFVKQKQKPSPTTTATRPAVLHLILDEHIGLEGLPLTNPEAARAKDELKAIYMSQGFRVYGGAYSEHLYTINAIPQILNFGDKSEAKADRDKGVILDENSYFEAMKHYGYKISIVQSDFAEYCSSSTYASCTTYWAESLRPLRDARFSTLERAHLMVFKFLSLSNGVRNLGDIVDAVGYGATIILGREIRLLDIYQRRHTSTVGALAAFDTLNSQLIRAQPGELYFMHVLAPHYPYVVRKDCSLRPPTEWESLTASQHIRENAYLAQVYCITGKVEAAVRAVSQSPAKDNFVVIVHGDHGSRITRWIPDQKNLGKFDDADMVAGFSTLFALKGPGLQPGYESRPAPVASLLGQWVEGEFRTQPRPEIHGTAQVYLGDTDWKPRQRYPLPQRWLDALAEVSP